eukprot:CAMPEP_0173078062 /NCGR_PEP_ID=MMETSP1102-20130122/13783_1 /TAXON_ID=49646 /ORGANISM="Geminigera sp., Strain Caron Lab Isolate" /LENGTH=397 /DNA_ID=CAMNT_0013949039 /DNA_START=68 /DNA_END=1261 /DNA_ORIENTATION=-
MSDGNMGGNTNSFGMSGVEGLPQSFGDYRPNHGTLSQDYADEIPPPAFNDLNDGSFKSFAVPPTEMPILSKIFGGPMEEGNKGNSFFEPAPLPTSMLADGGREKDIIFQYLMESEGGADRAAAINTPLIKERPTGVLPHQVAPEGKKIQVETDQGVYEGEMDQNRREGHGKCSYLNGNVYDGQWQNGKRHGRGHMQYASKASYDGEWAEGERNGHGVLKYSNGAQYEGQWVRDVKHGYGSYLFPSRAQYVGQWFEGKMHGQGTYNYADGQRFHGEFDRNLKGGHGTHVYGNKNQWNGVWVLDVPHGSGLYVYHDDQQKVECPFIKAGDPPPKVGKSLPALKLLRKEDKLRILDEGGDQASAAQLRASQAAQVSAEARALMYRVLSDTAEMLGLQPAN